MAFLKDYGEEGSHQSRRSRPKLSIEGDREKEQAYFLCRAREKKKKRAGKRNSPKGHGNSAESGAMLAKGDRRASGCRWCCHDLDFGARLERKRRKKERPFRETGDKPGCQVETDRKRGRGSKGKGECEIGRHCRGGVEGKSEQRKKGTSPS